MNKSRLGTIVFAMCTLLLAPILHGQELGPVSIEAKLEKDKAGSFVVKVNFDVSPGWHVYAEVPKNNPSPAVTVDLEFPEGVQANGDWNKPKGKVYVDDPSVKIYKSEFEMSRAIKASAHDANRELLVSVSYQACTDDRCQRPTTYETSVTIPPVETTDDSSSENEFEFEFESPFFTTPQILMVGEKRLNATVKQMYPSPAMYDVDNDGQMELVVGDIFGSLSVYENENSGDGDPVWAEGKFLETAEGEKISVSNW